MASCCLLLLAGSSLAAPGILVRAGQDSYPAAGSISYLADPSRTLDVQAVRGARFADRWRPVSAATPNLGYTADAYWFRFNVTEATGNGGRWILEIAYPLLDFVDVYIEHGGSLVGQYHTGDQRPFAQRPIQHANFIFPLELPADKTPLTLFVRVQTEGTLQLPIALFGALRYFELTQSTLGLQAVYFGMLMVMLIYNLFIFISVRERSYFYYVAYVGFFGLAQAALQGLGYQYLWAGSIWFEQISMALFAAGAVMFIALFANSFLSLRRYSPAMSFAMRLLAVVAGLVMAGSLFCSYTLMIRCAVALALAESALALIVAIVVARKGERAAYYFLAAWVVFLVGIFMIALNKYGVLPRTGLTENGIQIGSAIEVIVLSFALGDRINGDKREKYIAQKRLLDEANQRQQAELQLVHESLHDRLTGIPNRTALQGYAQNIIDHAMTRGRPIAVLLVYLSRFHEVNNTLGHENGDLLLKMVVKRLQNLAASLPGAQLIELGDDLEARHYLAGIEGVNFAILLEVESPDDALAAGESLVHAMYAPFRFMDMTLDIGAQVGIAVSPTHAVRFETLLRYAEVAVEAAQYSEGQAAMYSAQFDPYSARRLSLMGELHQAMAKNELQMFYQPQVDMRSRRVTGVEALLRWPHATDGYIAPDMFVPLAEQTGLIKPLTQWVLNSAISFAAVLRDSGLALGVSVNMSARNLREGDLTRRIQSLLALHDVPAALLTLELTETAMMEDQQTALRVLNELHAAGIRISIDDFGSGYSSLAYLRQLPISELKIDRSFVHDMQTGGDDGAVIVRTTINMAHEFKLRVVAEGVEHELSLEQLGHFGCDMVQGYLLGRPMPPEQFIEWLRHSQTRELFQLPQ